MTVKLQDGYKKKTLQYMWILNINDEWKKNWSKLLRHENFSVSIGWASIKYQSSRVQATIEKSGNFSIDWKLHSIDRNSGKLDFLKNSRSFMQKTLKPN